ncbi:MAG: hypothetical protein U0414_38885 [Polyangiaceae bacterium]
MKRIGRYRVLLGGFTAWGASLANCSSTPEKGAVVATPNGTHAPDPVGAGARPRPTGSAAADPGMDVRAEITRRVVLDNPLPFKHLYTWTTEEQLAELANGAALLSRSVSGKHGVSAFDDLVAADALVGKREAKLLWHEGYAKKRFAWPVLYAALRGSPEPVYGNVLIDVVMKNEAWALDYRTGVIHALDGSHPTPSDLEAHPERLAVVYHVGQGFREMVIVNESMIERWSAGGSRLVNDELRAEADYLIALAGFLDTGDPNANGQYAASLIFSDPFSATALRERAKLLDALRGLPLPAVERVGASVFTLGAARAALPPICKLVRRDSRKINYSSYRGASQTQYVAVCDAGDRAADRCVGGYGATASEANCTPSVDFGE